ncbi:MAG TPA: NHL repeat-containing protein [Mucilaginibacter sp.]
MKNPLLIAVLLISFAAILFGTGCKKTKADNTPPSLTTADVILDVTSTSAQSGGTVTSVGASAVTAIGVCYSATNHTPGLADAKTSETIGNSYSFISNLTGLKSNTTYYVRAYATNQFGTSYGSVVTFATSATLSSVTGTVTTFAGSGAGSYADGTGTGAQFNSPSGIALDAQGNMYVSDSFNNRIRKITPTGVVTTIAGTGAAGYSDGPGASAQFYGPQGLAVDSKGNIFVADYGNNVIRKITTAGVVSTVAGNTTAGHVDGAALSVAEFSSPAGVAVDAQGNLYVADYNNNMVRKITAAGVVSTIAGTLTAGYINGTVNTTTGAYVSFDRPNGIVVDAKGNIFISDLGNSAIREITPAVVVTTIAGGPGQTSLLGYPNGLTLDAHGNFFISDASGRIIELTAAKVLYDLAGTANVNGFADGSGTSAQFNSPQGIGVDAAGDIFVADLNNNRIRKVVIVSVQN